MWQPAQRASAVCWAKRCARRQPRVDGRRHDDDVGRRRRRRRCRTACARTNLPRSTGDVWSALACLARNAPCVSRPAARAGSSVDALEPGAGRRGQAVERRQIRVDEGDRRGQQRRQRRAPCQASARNRRVSSASAPAVASVQVRYRLRSLSSVAHAAQLPPLRARRARTAPRRAGPAAGDRSRPAGRRSLSRPPLRRRGQQRVVGPGARQQERRAASPARTARAARSCAVAPPSSAPDGR